MYMTSKSYGFTLIELMIAVAIIGILAAIALPAYNTQIAKGRRADARVQLIAAQQWLEKFYSENYSYSTDTAGNTAASSFNEQAFSRSPRVGDGTAIYTVTLNATTNSYTLTAAPIIGSAMASDSCGSLTLTSTGRKGASSDVIKCWK